MKKEFETKRTRTELEGFLANINHEYGISNASDGRIYVSCGNSGAYYRIDIDTPGKIIVERCMSLLDYILLTVFGLLFTIIALVINLTGDIKGTILGVSIIVAVTVAIMYPTFVVLPRWILFRVIKKWQA